jgi:hypothetical protein
MPPQNKPFPHLPLILRYDGPARFPQVVKKGDPRTKLAQNDRPKHSGSLGGSASNASSAWRLRVSDREQKNLPTLPKNMPLVLEVDTDLDLDELQKWFGFELVSEQENGFVIVATEDLDLNAFLQKLQDFVGQVTGSATVAKIYKLEDDPDQSKRLARILSERLLAVWPTLEEEEAYVVDVGVACSGEIQIPPQPGTPKRDRRWSDKTWARRQGEYATKMKEWTDQRNAAYMAWDDLSEERRQQVETFVTAYGGKVVSQFGKPHPEGALAGEFSLRIELKGKGLRDLVLNYPFLFEVVEPDDVSLPQIFREAITRDQENVTLVPPPANAPAVPTDRERCLDAGMDGYLTKPYRADALLDLVKGAVSLNEPAVSEPPEGMTAVMPPEPES